MSGMRLSFVLLLVAAVLTVRGRHQPRPRWLQGDPLQSVPRVPAHAPRLTRPADPNTSEAAKEHAAEVLADAGVEVERGTTGTSGTSEEAKHEHRVLGGYKATLSSTSPYPHFRRRRRPRPPPRRPVYAWY
jgi:hypothetical protein